MKITAIVSLLVAIGYAADAKDKEKTPASKTDKRDLLEGNYGDRTYLKNVLRSVEGNDYSNHEGELASGPTHVDLLETPCVHRLPATFTNVKHAVQQAKDYLREVMKLDENK